MSGLENNSKNLNSSKITNIIRSPPISSKPLPPTPSTKQTPIDTVVTQPLQPPTQQQYHHSSITRSNLISIANRERDPTTNARNLIKNQNRHTIAISANEDYESVFSSTTPGTTATTVTATLANTKLEDMNYGSNKNSSIQVIKSEQKNSFDSSSSPPPPLHLGKMPESLINNENWLSINELAAINNSNLKKSFVTRDTSGTREGNSNTGESSSSRSSSRNAMLTLASSIGTLGDSDHEMLESSATGLSGSGSNGGLEEDESGDDDIDSGSHNASLSALESDDFTTKRLKTFVATTLHNERVYLDKLSKLIKFKNYLEENFNGSQADISILFSGVQQVYTIHDVVASKLQGYLNSLTDLLINNSNYKSSPQMNNKHNQISSKLAAQLDTNHLNALPSSSNSLMKESFLSSALQLLASIMEISFPVYLEFLKNYSKAMTILNKLEEKTTSNSNSSTKTSSTNKTKKTFIDCQIEFNRLLQKENLKEKNTLASRLDKTHGQSSSSSSVQFIKTSPTKDPYNIYYNDVKKSEEVFDLTKIFAEEILRRPAKLFEFIHSLKDECILASNELPNNYSSVLQANIKSLFENESSKSLRDKVFDEINRNIMPKEVRKHEDVIELIESNNDRKIRHLILYGDCLVCCRIKKEKRQLKWFIPIDHLGISLDEYKSTKSDKELRHLREEVVSLRGNLKKQTEENASARNQQKIKKKLAEQENELTIQSSRLKLIIRSNPSLSTSSTIINSSGFFSHNSTFASISNSMTNLANLGQTNKNIISSNHSNNQNYISISENNYFYSNGAPLNNNNHLSSFSNSNNSNSANSMSANKFVFLFTSDFERNAWLEEINGAIYAFKTRKTTMNLQNSDIESRINSLKKVEEPPKAITSSCTGSLELCIKNIEELSQPNKVFVAVELKSCGSYLQVAQTRCTDLITNPVWNEKFNLELQCVDSLRIVLYCQTSSKALAISSQEIKIDSNLNLNKMTTVKLDNGTTIHVSMKFLSPKKTITRRRTRNRNDIFGGNLADLLQREKSTIPRILKDCVEVIESKGIEEVGIYRVSSVVSEVQKMKDLYSKNPNQALNELRLKSPHLSANVLKLYLRELPDPLFTSHLYHRFMKALDCSMAEFRQVELCRTFNDLPESNKTIIFFILTHLLNISNHSDKNMMGLQNLCTLFGPTLMKLSPKDNREIQVEDMSKEIKESMQQAQVLFYLLQLHAEDRLLTDPEAQDNKTSLTSFLNDKTTSDLNENLTKMDLKPISSKQGDESLRNSAQQQQATDKNNNNYVNFKAANNLPENNSIPQNTAPKTPARQQQTSGEKYAKLNMQTAL